ncbi:hypothetical protein [Acinetobacter puyangensis]|uniref:hypothetical protein n=1 Tax=Acinetobacter puyangensis TaxID=1096779 RepID=UPI003A4E1807
MWSRSLLLVLLFFCVGCTQEIETPNDVTLHFGEQSIQDFQKYTGGKIDRQPAGMNFMTLNWQPPHLGNVKIDNRQASLVIDHVFSVMGVQVADDPHIKGITALDIDASLHQAEFVSSQDAYIAYVKLMEHLNQQGWKQFFYRSDARIAKEDNLKHVFERFKVIDPTHRFSYEEWQKVMNNLPAGIVYRLYNNGIFLSVSLYRSAVNEKKQEQYMLRYDIQTIRYNERNTIEKSYEMNDSEFAAAFEKAREREKLSRQEEQEMKAKGYRIDESYVDPDVWEYIK